MRLFTTVAVNGYRHGSLVPALDAEPGLWTSLERRSDSRQDAVGEDRP